MIPISNYSVYTWNTKHIYIETKEDNEEFMKILVKEESNGRKILKNDNQEVCDFWEGSKNLN